MILKELALDGAYLIEVERIEDERGFFARTWCAEEFEAQGLIANLIQCNISFNRTRGTFRGIHYQAAPHEEAKLVRCTQGRIFDVLVDVRDHSPTYLNWYGTELSAGNRRAVYIPPGFAHGFITMESDTEVFYQMSQRYAPESARGVRWDDPAVGVKWPIPVSVISQRDAAYPLLSP